MNFVQPEFNSKRFPMGNMKRDSTRYVYFIQGEATGLIKIGKANDPGTRLKGLQTGSPDHLVLLGVIPCTKTRETELHEDFKAFKVHGEWFKPSAELLSFIAKTANPWVKS